MPRPCSGAGCDRLEMRIEAIRIETNAVRREGGRGQGGRSHGPGAGAEGRQEGGSSIIQVKAVMPQTKG